LSQSCLFITHKESSWFLYLDINRLYIIIYRLHILFVVLIYLSYNFRALRPAQNLPVLQTNLAAGNAFYIAYFFRCQYIFAKKFKLFYHTPQTIVFTEFYFVYIYTPQSLL